MPRPKFRSHVLAAGALAAVLALPAPAAVSGAAELGDTTWELDGRITTSASAQGEKASTSSKSGAMRTSFLGDGVLEIQSEKYGRLTGAYAPHPSKARKASGELDVESLSAAIADFERRNEKQIRKQLGFSANVVAEVRSTQLKVKLNRSGDRMRAKAKVSFRGRVSTRGGGARFSGAFRLRLSGSEAVE